MKIDIEDLESMFTMQPDLGASTKEPELEQIIYVYYRRYFDKEEALDISARYKTAIMNMFYDKYAPEPKCVNAHDLCYLGGPCPYCERSDD